MSERFHDIAMTVNGEDVRERVEARQTLVDFLRETLALTGSHVGCEHGVCGACTVRVDGEVVRGCLMLAVQCDGAHVETIEGVSDSGEIADLQAAFEKRNALQCGFCTPGMLLTAQELLHRARQRPSREAIRDHISGNYCRCTGYQAIVDAIEAVAQQRAGDREHENRPTTTRPSSPRSTGPIPISAARCRGQPRAADARPRAIRQRRHVAAHGACRLRAFAARACENQEH